MNDPHAFEHDAPGHDSDDGALTPICQRCCHARHAASCRECACTMGTAWLSPRLALASAPAVLVIPWLAERGAPPAVVIAAVALLGLVPMLIVFARHATRRG